MSVIKKQLPCRECGETKLAAEFYYHRGRKRYMDVCKECSKKLSTAYHKVRRDAGDYKMLMRLRAAGIKRDCKLRKGGVIEVSPNLSNILVALWEEQAGKCFYTDLPMLLGTGLYFKDPTFCTVDRIDSARGYVEGNVVLCRARVNRFKGVMSTEEWFALCAMITKRRKKIEQQIKLKG